MEIIITSLFRKLTKIPLNNFKIAINGSVGNVQKYFFCINPYLSTNKKFYHMFTGSVLYISYLNSERNQYTYPFYAPRMPGSPSC